MGRPYARALERSGQFRSFMVMSRKVFKHRHVTAGLSDTIYAGTEVSRQCFTSGHPHTSFPPFYAHEHS